MQRMNPKFYALHAMEKFGIPQLFWVFKTPLSPRQRKMQMKLCAIKTGAVETEHQASVTADSVEGSSTIDNDKSAYVLPGQAEVQEKTNTNKEVVVEKNPVQK